LDNQESAKVHSESYTKSVFKLKNVCKKITVINHLQKENDTIKTDNNGLDKKQLKKRLVTNLNKLTEEKQMKNEALNAIKIKSTNLATFMKEGIDTTLYKRNRKQFFTKSTHERKAEKDLEAFKEKEKLFDSKFVDLNKTFNSLHANTK